MQEKYRSLSQAHERKSSRIEAKAREKMNLVIDIGTTNIIFFDEWAHFENGVKARIEPQKFQSIFVYADSFEWKFEINRKEK